MITPTYARLTQKSDLTSVCLTVMHVRKLVWIVVEDSDTRTYLVAKLLARCKVSSVHLNVVTPDYYKHDKWKPRGVLQRNAGLSWIRDHHSIDNCSGVVYFGDDDNSYDLRVFEEMKETKGVSVWPVAFSGGVKIEGPLCKDGVIDKWHSGWGSERPFPIDMAGFAIHLCLLMRNPKVLIGRDRQNRLSKPGYLESNLLEQLVDKDLLECRGPPDEAIVWHVKTAEPDIPREHNDPSDPLDIEV
ncbi:Galactosylgalactosylxylosylprotein 3-beta-glucuronosyltransferase 2 [Geodia barretti]|uniref:Galactosylgalactosylxylosylprotein 3-beta-glucuronosyltransferase n=1 Tax=Geodia barretti TaxID=519541 RepID=A0AA35SSH0_GEOBA|nr:Galactosylgalactosylxylosylprotein 3-beta-glucuronosyltransferase 2 [Geodia barretti]